MTAKNLRAGLAAGIKDTPKRPARTRDRFERADEVLELDRDPEARARVAEPSVRPDATVRGPEPERGTDRVVREIVSMPAADLELLERLRERCLASGLFVSKSEMVRAGLHALALLPVEEVSACVDRLEKRRPGRRRAS